MSSSHRWIRTIVGLAILAIAILASLPWLVPTFERANIFLPGRYDPARPWSLPPLTEDLWFDTADGVRLHGWLLRSEHRPARGAMVYFHGNGGTLADYMPTVGRLRESGFDVMAWDYRGYGRSAGVPDDERTLYLDGDAAIAAAALRTGLAPQHLLLYGYSLGTVVATEMAVRHDCRALVLQAPLASLRSHIATQMPWLPAMPYRYLRNSFATVEKVGKLDCPLLVIHGENDEGILVSQGKAVFDAAREPKRLHIVPGGRHYLDGQTGWPHIEAAVRFFDEMAK